ncbi:MAG: hypothetical protein II897_01520 [Clostridia bacterium]|nr:hypothetical protein [Clostridia bacterium]
MKIDAVQAATFITDKKSDELIEKLAALGGNNRAELLTRNLVAFNTRKHTNEQVYYAVLNIETALLKKKKVLIICSCCQFRNETSCRSSHD